MPVAQATTEHLVRMGELVVSAGAGDVLACVGLGSCIGLALIDRRAAIAGLAHIMLPSTPAHATSSARHADHAVPALYDEMLAVGAARHRLDAILVGGAAMFSLGGSGQEIGERNEAAVRKHLEDLRLPVRAAATGGGRGRTMRVRVEDGSVVVKEAGGTEMELFTP